MTFLSFGNKSRRFLLKGMASMAVTAATMPILSRASQAAPAVARRLFDSHCHIIDPEFPLVANQGYTPPIFTIDDYLSKAWPLGVVFGAVVSASYQGYDQTYLKAALQRLGRGWVGVAQLPNTVSDNDILDLTAAGVRGLRFNMYRGQIDNMADAISLARRVNDIGGWHSEFYADAAALRPHVDALGQLPRISIDHLGMSEDGLPVLRDLVRSGSRVKATGFGRLNFDVPKALEMIADVDPDALMFGSDMPSTRAPRPFDPRDVDLIETTLGTELATRVFWDNPIWFYRVPEAGAVHVNRMR